MSFRNHKKALLLNVAVHETFYVLNRGSWFSSKRLVVDLLCWAMRTLSLAINGSDCRIPGPLVMALNSCSRSAVVHKYLSLR